MRYHDLTIEADGLRGLLLSDGRRLVQFHVRVLDSPAGEMRPEQAIAVEYIEEELAASINALAARTLDSSGMLALAQTLGILLLPPPPDDNSPGVRNMVIDSLRQIGADDGLRLRLRLPPELAALPWEYAHLERSGSDATNGFLSLDPRIAIVRHEPLAAADLPPYSGQQLRLVAALASPEGLPILDLTAERRAIEQACAHQAGIDLAVIDQATSAQVEVALHGAEIFHFAGHGLIQAGGAIALADGRYSANQLAAALHSNGVRLALLGGCETGRRDGHTVWSGTAPTLVRAELPAVVAYQFTIRDNAAIAFSGAFYQALVGGLPVERAVAAGRLAAYAIEPQGREWGAIVLYLRASDGFLFAGSSDDTIRTQAAKTITAALDVRAGQLADSEIIVMQVGTIKADNLNLKLSVNAPQLGSGNTIIGIIIDEL
jgi:hypothetical protein